MIREYKRAHGLPEDGKIGQQLLTTMGLTKNRRSIWIRWLAINTPKLVIWQSYIPEGGLLSRARRGEVDPSVLFFKDWGIKVGLRRLY